MSEQAHDGKSLFRQKFEDFKQYTSQGGEQFAWEKMLEGYPERQKRRMGPFINAESLATGFRKAIPALQQMGMEMDVIDISTTSVDAVLEVQRKCPVLSLCAEYGIARPCHIICEMDIEATRRAFPEVNGKILCAQADGACVCVFKYERACTARPERRIEDHETE